MKYETRLAINLCKSLYEYWCSRLKEVLKMCDVCKSKGLAKTMLNGSKENYSVTTMLYQVFLGKRVEIELCYLHDIELFKKGERRFISTNLEVMPILWQSKVAA
mgnify:CR=1 FL=1